MPRAAGSFAEQAGGTEWSSAKRKRRVPAARQSYSGTRIACTRGGCGPIPRGCGIVAERDWNGNPTGFDAIVCPWR